MFASGYGSKSVFVSTVRTINIATGKGVGYSGAGANYISIGSSSGTSSGTSSGGSTGGSTGGNYPMVLSYYTDLAGIISILNPIIEKYSIGDFIYVLENFTQVKYYELVQEIYKLKQDATIYPEYEMIRLSINNIIEGLNKAVQLYIDYQSNKLQLTTTTKRANILDDMTELRKYINSLVGSINLFPDIAITSVAATLKPEIAIYIKLYGFPTGGIFNSDKLAFAIKLATNTI